jgi:hypothetical protein
MRCLIVAIKDFLIVNNKYRFSGNQIGNVRENQANAKVSRDDLNTVGDKRLIEGVMRQSLPEGNFYTPFYLETS